MNRNNNAGDLEYIINFRITRAFNYMGLTCLGKNELFKSQSAEVGRYDMTGGGCEASFPQSTNSLLFSERGGGK
jgi:hypothetical protein